MVIGFILFRGYVTYKMLDPQRTYGYFRDRYPMKKSTNNWYSFDCPICNKSKKGAVHFDYQQVKCWAGCYKEGIAAWVAQMEGVSFSVALKMLWDYDPANIDLKAFEVISTEGAKISDVKLPFGFTSIVSGEGILGKRARAYMVEERGLDLKLLDYLGVGYVNQKNTESSQKQDDYFGYIITPFKRGGSLYYYIGRDFTGSNFLKHKNPAVSSFGIGKSELFFNEDALNRKTVTVVESAFCAMTLGRAGTATLGKELSVPQKTKIIRSDCENVIIAYDKGAYNSGLRAGLGLLDHKNVYVVDMDRHQGAGKDPNEMGKKAVMDLIADTPKLTFEMALSGLV